MSGHRDFKEPVAKMSPERRARIKIEADELASLNDSFPDGKFEWCRWSAESVKGYLTWLVAKGRLSRAAASANSTGVSLRSWAVERTSLAGMSPPPQARRMSSRACLTAAMSNFLVARSGVFMVCVACLQWKCPHVVDERVRML